MAEYSEALFNYAKANSMSAVNIRALNYRGVAAGAGVSIKPNGDSPADFFYVNVRNQAANALEKEEVETALENERAALETQIRKVSGFDDANVVIAPDGSFEIRKPDQIIAEIP